MTLLWFVIWLISNVVRDTESLTFDPVNWWAGLLNRVRWFDSGRGMSTSGSTDPDGNEFALWQTDPDPSVPGQ